VRRAIAVLTLDIVGFSMISGGVYLIHQAAGIIVGGLSCALMGWVVETFKKEGDG
jgi:predicted S18 family serine protease